MSKRSVLLILFGFYMGTSQAAILTLNDTEYEKMPPVFRLEPYRKCLEEDVQGLYCNSELALVADETDNQLLRLIQEYSDYKRSHYNHSLLRYNVCVSKTCREFYNGTVEDPTETLETCFNKTLHEKYGLKVKVQEIRCRRADEKIKVEAVDVAFFFTLAGIVMINLIGTIHDIYWTDGEKRKGIPFLLCFAARRNWRKLVSPALDGPDPRLKRLKVLSFLKTGTMMLVISVHTISPSMFYIENTKYLEDLASGISIQIFMNGSVSVQTFFIITGFLLTYNLEKLSEKESFKVNWLLLPKGYLLRWLRLFPIYGLQIFFMVSACRLLAYYGPIWEIITHEVAHCRRNWWQHLLYINNYNDSSYCMLHTWYLAADTQLYVLGLAVYIVCHTPARKKAVLASLLALGVVIPVVQTYLQDLEGAVATSPEDTLHFFTTNREFNNLYRRGHTNLVSVTVGLALGYITYYGQRTNFDVQRLKAYRLWYYLVVPAGAAVVTSGAWYHRGARPALPVRLLYAATLKPLWCLCLAIGTLVCIFKLEDFVRPIIEWRGFTVTSRLCYCVFMCHTAVVRLLFNAHDSVNVCDVIATMERAVYTIVVANLLAVVLWVMVEQPCTQLVKIAFLKHSDEEKACPVVASSGSKENGIDQQPTTTV